MLCVFMAKIVEDLDAITEKGEPIVNHLVLARQEVIESPEFDEFSRIRELARIEEALVVGSAVRAANRENAAVIEDLNAENAAVIEDLKAKAAAVVKEKDTEIAHPRSLLGQGSGDN
jgi:hypothetical protein